MDTTDGRIIISGSRAAFGSRPSGVTCNFTSHYWFLCPVNVFVRSLSFPSHAEPNPNDQTLRAWWSISNIITKAHLPRAPTFSRSFQEIRYYLDGLKTITSDVYIFSNSLMPKCWIYKEHCRRGLYIINTCPHCVRSVSYA